MEFTGEFYYFYSDKPLKSVLEEFSNQIQEIHFQIEQTELFGEKSLFCFKNQEMYDYHLEQGYNIDLDGKGCFAVEAKETSLNGSASLYEFKGKSDFEPQPIQLSIQQIYHYRLILPAVIESSSFSQKIYDLFTHILNNQPKTPSKSPNPKHKEVFQ